MRNFRKQVSAAAVLVALTFAAGAARADCYDVFGCTDRNAFKLADLLAGPTCEFLYTMRNGIYAQHGYCFHTARGKATFGDANCVSGDPERLGLSRLEKSNAATILKAEKVKGCPE